MSEIVGYIQKIILFLLMISVIMECVKGMKCEKYIRSVLSIFFILMVITPIETFVTEDSMDDAILYFTGKMERSVLNSQLETADDVTKELLLDETKQQIQEMIEDYGKELKVNVQKSEPVLQYTSSEQIQITSIRVEGEYTGNGEITSVSDKFKQTVAGQLELDQNIIHVSLVKGEGS